VVDLERADAEHAFTTAAGLGECRAPQVRVDPSGEDSRVKRLRDVVVDADLEADDLIHPGRAAGEHDHRTHNALPPQLADHLGAADIGQHPVHKYEVRLCAPAQLDGLRARTGFDYVMTLKPADLGHKHSHGNVVLDHQDASTSTRWRAAQFCVGGAKPTRRDSRAERFGLRIRITRLSPPSITLARSHPSAAASWMTLTRVTPSATWVTLRTLVENSHSRVGSPTAGTSPAAAPRAPSGEAGCAGSSGSSSGSSSNRGSIVVRL